LKNFNFESFNLKNFNFKNPNCETFNIKRDMTPNDSQDNPRTPRGQDNDTTRRGTRQGTRQDKNKSQEAFKGEGGDEDQSPPYYSRVKVT